MDWSTSMLPEDIFLDVASHWDVVTLVEKKRVCRDWKDLCTEAIDAKRTDTTKRAFATNQELKDAVKMYCGYDENTTYRYSQRCSQEDAEEIATAYGYPINKWDVSMNQDFSSIFEFNSGFNEDIGLWRTLACGIHRMPQHYIPTNNPPEIVLEAFTLSCQSGVTRTGLQVSPAMANYPIKAWRLVFTAGILDKIVAHTNKYVQYADLQG
jgi:hypothetical protein